jgi:hypothetical protein
MPSGKQQMIPLSVRALYMSYMCLLDGSEIVERQLGSWSYRKKNKYDGITSDFYLIPRSRKGSAVSSIKLEMGKWEKGSCSAVPLPKRESAPRAEESESVSRKALALIGQRTGFPEIGLARLAYVTASDWRHYTIH